MVRPLYTGVCTAILVPLTNNIIFATTSQHQQVQQRVIVVYMQTGYRASINVAFARICSNFSTDFSTHFQGHNIDMRRFRIPLNNSFCNFPCHAHFWHLSYVVMCIQGHTILYIYSCLFKHHLMMIPALRYNLICSAHLGH